MVVKAMSVKLAILHDSIDRCKMLIEAKEELLSTNWIGEVCRLRIDAQKLLRENPTNDSQQTKEIVKKLNEMAEQEKIYLRNARRASNAMKNGKIFNEISKLHIELQNLQRELFWEERKQKRAYS